MDKGKDERGGGKEMLRAGLEAGHVKAGMRQVPWGTPALEAT